MADKHTFLETLGLLVGGGTVLAVLCAELTFVGWLWLS
jgi:hypothetical protein